MKNVVKALMIIACAALLLPTLLLAKPAEKMMELDKEVTEATMEFKKEIKEAEKILSSAKGYLIFPEITKAGVGIGGEYGKGALVEKGEVVGYYSTKAASVGAQLGVQTKSMVLAFNTEETLKKFKESNGWEVGLDGQVTIAEIGEGGSINTTTTLNKPVVAYIYGEEGLMADVSLKGSKISKLES